MGTLNKSFVCGILVASTTWIISLYLYWNLMYNSDNINIRSMGPTDQHKMQQYNSNNANLNNHISDERSKMGHSKDLYEEKVRRYKKERKFRKVSQKLIDELRPTIIFSGNQVICTNYIHLHSS